MVAEGREGCRRSRRLQKVEKVAEGREGCRRSRRLQKVKNVDLSQLGQILAVKKVKEGRERRFDLATTKTPCCKEG
jgi:hypothetical protein